MKDGRKVGLMLTITTEDSQFDDQQLIKAQHQTLPPDADRDDVYTIADIRRVMSES